MTMVGGMIVQSQSSPDLLPSPTIVVTNNTTNMPPAPLATVIAGKTSGKTKQPPVTTITKALKTGQKVGPKQTVSFMPIPTNQETKSAALGVTALNKTISQHELFASESEQDAIVTMNLLSATCSIKVRYPFDNVISLP